MQRLQIPIVGGAVLVVTWDANGTGGTGSGNAAQELDQIRQRLNNRAPLIERVFRIMRVSARKQFLEGGNPRWKELQPATVARKQGRINRGTLPPRTKTGRIPLRVRQIPPGGGQPGYSATNILIERGDLRDSWSVKGARGHVERVEGDQLLFGSQLTIERDLEPDQELRHYHVVTKKALRARAKGSRISVRIPLARIHQEGAPAAGIDPRPVGTTKEDLAAIQEALVQWLQGALGDA